MTTITAGTRKKFTAKVRGTTLTVITSTGTYANLSGDATASIGPSPSRRTFGPLETGQSITVAASIGDVIVEFGDASPGASDAGLEVPPSTLAGRPMPRGRRVVQMGGSETARGYCVKPSTATGVVWDAAAQLVRVTTTGHNMHSGALVFIANENATAPSLNGGLVTADNGFCLGNITVVSSTEFTIPYWVAMAGVPAYANLSGTSTSAFAVHKLQQFSPNNKLAEMNRWLGHPFTIVGCIATGSTNTMALMERLPALVYMAQNDMFDELRGTLGVGNTLLYAQSHSWTVPDMVLQIVNDVTAMCTALADYGIITTLEVPPPQLNSSGTSTAGTLAVIEALRQLALNPALRLTLEDEFTASVDPATGLARVRYQANGTDNVHPSNEGCVTRGYEHAQLVKGVEPAQVFRLARSALDNYKADSTSLQLMDPFLAATTTVTASSATAGSDTKQSGVIPEVIRTLASSGNASRAFVWTYERIGEVYYAVCEGTFAGATDTLTVSISNPTGVRALSTLLTANVGGTFVAGLDFGLVPKTGAAPLSIDCYTGMTATYGAITARTAYLSADTQNDTANTDGPMTSPRMGPAVMQPFTLPSDSNFSCTAAAITVVVTSNGAGTFTLFIALPTLRRIA